MNSEKLNISPLVETILKRGSAASTEKAKKDATPQYFATFSKRVMQRLAEEEKWGWEGLLSALKEFFFLDSGEWALARLSGALASVVLAITLFQQALLLQKQHAPITASLNAARLEREILLAAKSSDENIQSLSLWQFACGFTTDDSDKENQPDLAMDVQTYDGFSRAFQAAENESLSEEENDEYQTLTPEEIKALIQTL